MDQNSLRNTALASGEGGSEKSHMSFFAVYSIDLWSKKVLKKKKKIRLLKAISFKCISHFKPSKFYKTVWGHSNNTWHKGEGGV